MSGTARSHRAWRKQARAGRRLHRRVRRAAISFALEGISFRQSIRQAKPEADSLHRDLIEHVLATSYPTLRAVFAEDSAALIGLVVAAAGLGAHQLTGSPVPDAAGSILVGMLLAVVAVVLINSNRRFLVGQEADPRVRAAAIQALLDAPEVARVTYLRLEIVGPRMISIVPPSVAAALVRGKVVEATGHRSGHGAGQPHRFRRGGSGGATGQGRHLGAMVDSRSRRDHDRPGWAGPRRRDP